MEETEATVKHRETEQLSGTEKTFCLFREKTF
jgi:hypothetical protein